MLSIRNVPGNLYSAILKVTNYIGESLAKLIALVTRSTPQTEIAGGFDIIQGMQSLLDSGKKKLQSAYDITTKKVKEVVEEGKRRFGVGLASFIKDLGLPQKIVATSGIMALSSIIFSSHILQFVALLDAIVSLLSKNEHFVPFMKGIEKKLGHSKSQTAAFEKNQFVGVISRHSMRFMVSSLMNNAILSTFGFQSALIVSTITCVLQMVVSIYGHIFVAKGTDAAIALKNQFQKFMREYDKSPGDVGEKPSSKGEYK